MARNLNFKCPECGEGERLKGRRERAEGRPKDEVIRISCEACGHEWIHDPWLCPRCGERMHAERVPLLQKARGTQQSIIGYRTEKRCIRCDPPREEGRGAHSATLDDQ